MSNINKIKSADLNIYTRLLDYIHTEDDPNNVSSTVISSSDKKHLSTSNKSGNLVSKLTSAVIAIKDDTSSGNIKEQLDIINSSVLQLNVAEPITSSGNLMKLLKVLPWDDSSLTLVVVEQLFKNLKILTGDGEYYRIFQKLKLKKLGRSSKQFDIEEFRGNLQIESLDLVENLRLLDNVKDKEFWSLSLIVAMKDIGLYSTVEELQSLIYWRDDGEIRYLDSLLSKIDEKRLTEEEFIVYCQALMLRSLPEDHLKVVSLIEKELVEKSGTINLYLKNIVIEACEKISDRAVLMSVCEKILKGLNDYKVLLKYVDSYVDLNKSATKQDIVAVLDGNFAHFSGTRNFRLIKVYLDYKFGNGFENLHQYLDIFHNKPCCIADVGSLVSKEVLISALKTYESSPARDFNLYKLTKEKEGLYSLGDSLDFRQYQIIDDLDSQKSLNMAVCGDILAKLEKLSQDNSETFQFRLLQMVLYNSLSLYKESTDIYHGLQIKNMQKLSLDSLLTNIIPLSTPENNISLVEELNNFDYILSLCLEKKTYSKFSGLVKFAIKLNNSNVVIFKYLEKIKKQRFFGNKQYRDVLNKCIKTLLEFGIENTKDDELELPFTLTNQWDYSSNTDELWYCLLKEFYILKSLEGGSFKYERIIDVIANEKMSSNYQSPDNLVRWQFDFFKEYSGISNDNDKIAIFLDKIQVPFLDDSTENLGSFSQPWQILNAYITVLETFKTLDSIKKFQNNKTLKSKIKPILRKIRDHSSKFEAAYLAFFADCSDKEIQKSIESNIKLVKSL